MLIEMLGVRDNSTEIDYRPGDLVTFNENKGMNNINHLGIVLDIRDEIVDFVYFEYQFNRTHAMEAERYYWDIQKAPDDRCILIDGQKLPIRYIEEDGCICWHIGLGSSSSKVTPIVSYKGNPLGESKILFGHYESIFRPTKLDNFPGLKHYHGILKLSNKDQGDF